MAKKYYETQTLGNGVALTIANKHPFGKPVPIYAEVDDQTGEVKLFIRHTDLPKLAKITPLDDFDIS
ncbi:hypothetical protein [Schleiferilactobacillus perolens]|uniref:Uncharacterized protein n=1 Tax=Schleiferilactobacillus perolens DSM 12744 TaxID=1423792 RepID=A0A0R1N011_9LACO|nr:hypothetical protein [Schleiferilactobacillus perolens]KRL13388.1 hypothetical protein FD09_GL002219 [Schleiferilactobacillus perolens DSM 12744]